MACVMIIDDDEDFTFAVSTVLRNAGHEVRVELDIKSAVKSMETKPPELVILDVMFPEDASGGLKLARTIRYHNEMLSDIPVLMVTAMNDKFRSSSASLNIDENRLPVSGFMEKPVDFNTLLDKVNTLLQKKVRKSIKPIPRV